MIYVSYKLYGCVQVGGAGTGGGGVHRGVARVLGGLDAAAKAATRRLAQDQQLVDEYDDEYDDSYDDLVQHGECGCVVRCVVLRRHFYLIRGTYLRQGCLGV
jgi:hypothetical protein